LAQDAVVSEKPKFTALRVVGNATSGEFFILAVGNLSALHEFRPIIDMAALVDSEVTVMTCLSEWR
jgi:hypothetical protein